MQEVVCIELTHGWNEVFGCTSMITHSTVAEECYLPAKPDSGPQQLQDLCYKKSCWIDMLNTYDLGRFLNVWDRLVRCCIPKRLRFDEDVGDDEHTERGRALLRQEQARGVAGILGLFRDSRAFRAFS